MRYKIDKKTGCWDWQGSLDTSGYGLVKINCKLYKAHIISFNLHKAGIQNKNACVLHKCDNPKCINPEYLFIGTKLDNAKDRDKKGHWRNWYRVFTKKQIRRIKQSKKSIHLLADYYGVSSITIHNIRIGKTYKDI